MADITIQDLTTGALDGTGVFDVLMAAVEVHIESEYKKGRIKGPEYSTVYLGAMQAVLDRALQFLLAQERTNLELQLLTVQIANAEKEGLRIDAETAQAEQQTLNLIATGLNIPKEGLVLDGQKCLLDAQYDLTVEQKAKAIAETAVLAQKKITEQAQVSGAGVDADSVIGKQKALYTAQTEGFVHDAKQKVAKILIDTWNTRRMTDEGTVADGTNKLADVNVGRAVESLLDSINA